MHSENVVRDVSMADAEVILEIKVLNQTNFMEIPFELYSKYLEFEAFTYPVREQKFEMKQRESV